LFSRVDGFILLNSFHTPTLNQVFNSITFIGDGLFSIIVSFFILIFAKKHSKLALIVMVAYLSSGIVAQIFKAIIYAPRPSLYFKLHEYKYYIDTFATSRAGANSFPSGHSASVFALVTVFSVYCKRKYISFCLIVIGILAGYSRIYLAHHFLIDVLAGMILGLLFGTLSLIWLDKLDSTMINAFLSKYNPVNRNKRSNSILNN
jgi:undecaprenyl-diphosphatase